MINTLELPKVGEKVYIKALSTSTRKTYVCQILDTDGEKKFTISGPIYKSTLIPLHINTEIEVTYYKESRGRFLFNSTIIEREDKGIYKIKVIRTGDIVKLQERSYFRLQAATKVLKKHKIVNDRNIRDVEENCTSEDISGGGLRLMCNYEHSIGELVKCFIEIDNSSIFIEGEIIRVEKIDSPDYKFALGVKFLDIKNEDRDKIIRYIFEQQRRLRKKGLI